MTGIQFRASACGCYIVSLIGELPRVLTTAEAIEVAKLYRDKAAEMTDAGRPIMAEHERVIAQAMEHAINAAGDIILAQRRREEARRAK